MKVEKQLKNDQYNIFKFVKYVSDIEKKENVIVFLNEEYKKEEINKLFQKGLEYHSIFGTNKFDIWLLLNQNKLKESIIYVSISKLNKQTKTQINKLRKYSEEIILEFTQNIKIEEVKEYAKTINKNIIVGYTNYDTKELRKVIMLAGKNFEYKETKKHLKILAIMHVYNEEDVIETTIKHLIEQGIDIYILENWSTDKTYEIAKKMQEKYPQRITLQRFPEKEPKENNYEWEKQLKKTEELSKKLNYDWFIHHDTDEIRITPYNTNITLSQMIHYVDSLGYNAINTTVLDFRITNEKDEIFAKDAYYEIGRKPSHFMQIKTWKKAEQIDLTSSGGHIVKFENQKLYPLKIINKHYPLRSIKQAEKKIFQDRLPRVEKEKKSKGWHIQYDKMAENKDIIYEKENLNKYGKNTKEHLTLELISGIGIDKL